MGITVNVARFEAVRRRMQEASMGNFLPALTVRMAAAITKQLADEYRESRDPYGNAWKPVFRRRRKDRLARQRAYKRASLAGKSLATVRDLPLVDSGRMRALSIAHEVSSTGVRVIIPVAYASYHQEGTRHIARRQIVPDDKTGGLGPIWTAALNREANAVLRETVRGT